MAKTKEPFNPFYALLVVVGVIFFVTATAYGVMTFKAVKAASAVASTTVEAPHPLLVFLDEQGLKLLGAELVVLALATFGAMGTDSYWTKRAERKDDDANQH